MTRSLYRASLTLSAALLCVSLAAGWTGYGTAVGGAIGDLPAQDAPSAREVKVKWGQEAVLEGDELRIKFASLVEDGRCPMDVECVWAGNAVIELKVSHPEHETRTMTLHTLDRRLRVGKYERYTIGLVALVPYPGLLTEVRPTDYVATLSVSKE